MLTPSVSELIVLPPNATHLWQALDKLFGSWHKAYTVQLVAWKGQHPGEAPGREAFVWCFEKAWPTWVTPAEIKYGFKAVGWTATTPGVDRGLFPDTHDLFVMTAAQRVSHAC